MAQEIVELLPEKTPLFNSSLETGTRTVILLEAIYPKSVDLSRLVWLDHLVVHTGDIGGPASLHPDIPQRTGELLVRRRLVERGLELMWRSHLLDRLENNDGVQYQAREEATAFVELLRTNYSRDLKARAKWIAAFYSEITDEDLSRLITERIGRWSVEFQDEPNFPDSLV